MAQEEWLAEQFEKHRERLHSIAYRMLGSLPEAEDAVQDAWIRVSRAGAEDVENFGGWLTVIVSRISLSMLRARRRRREDHFGVHVPDPVLEPAETVSAPDDEAQLADSVGLALLVLLDALSPAERLAFVLHDMFELSFERIAEIIGRTSEATRQLASRGRRRINGADLRLPDSDIRRQREVADAYFRAIRAGDFESLMNLLDPDVLLRADFGSHGPQRSIEISGAAQVAKRSRADPNAVIRPALVNGAAGAVTMLDGKPFAILSFTIVKGKIVEINVIADPQRLGPLVEKFP